MSAEDTTVTTPADRPVVIFQRTFPAPAADLWRAMTTRELVERWYGPRRYKVQVPELDLRVGGRWRFVNIDSDGTTYGFHGEFVEIVPEKRLVQTWIFEGVPDEVVTETAEFDERDGETTLTSTAEYPSMQSRDANIQVGMLDGARETYDRLAEVLESMARS